MRGDFAAVSLTGRPIVKCKFLWFVEAAVWLLFAIGPSWAADPRSVESDSGPVAPDLPVADIQITDTTGRPVTGAADIGQLLIISSAKSSHGGQVGSLLWIVDADPPAVLQSYTSPDGQTLIVNTGLQKTTLRLMQIVAKGERAAYQRVLVKIGQGDIPPPGPEPGPQPQPTPTPKAAHLALSVVYDPTSIDAPSAIVLNSHDIWQTFKAQGHQWIYYSHITKEPSGLAAVKLASEKGVKLPALVIDDADAKKNLAVVPLPDTVEKLQATVKQYTPQAKTVEDLLGEGKR